MAKKKILICDDDMDFSKILVLRLTKNDYEVQVAVDGTQIMAKARHWQPDCIVLDINMPAGNAYQTLRFLEQNVNTLTIPVILMSGADPDFSKIGEIYQPNFLKKPFDVNQLIEKIESLTAHQTNEDSKLPDNSANASRD